MLVYVIGGFEKAEQDVGGGDAMAEGLEFDLDG